MMFNSGYGTHKPARKILIAAAIIASAVSALTEAEEQVVTIRLTPDPHIEAHIRNIQGPERVVRISMDRPQDSPSKSQDVSVRGPIADSHVSSLVHSAVAGRQGYWTSNNSWMVSVVGDEQYAIVEVAHFCGELCGGGAKYTYTFKDGRWNFEYTSHQWIS
jgi:hypothetical protein